MVAMQLLPKTGNPECGSYGELEWRQSIPANAKPEGVRLLPTLYGIIIPNRRRWPFHFNKTSGGHEEGFFSGGFLHNETILHNQAMELERGKVRNN